MYKLFPDEIDKLEKLAKKDTDNNDCKTCPLQKHNNRVNEWCVDLATGYENCHEVIQYVLDKNKQYLNPKGGKEMINGKHTYIDCIRTFRDKHDTNLRETKEFLDLLRKDTDFAQQMVDWLKESNTPNPRIYICWINTPTCSWKVVGDKETINHAIDRAQATQSMSFSIFNEDNRYISQYDMR